MCLAEMEKLKLQKRKDKEGWENKQTPHTELPPPFGVGTQGSGLDPPNNRRQTAEDEQLV